MNLPRHPECSKAADMSVGHSFTPHTGITASNRPTGVSVDAAGKIWADCWDSDVDSWVYGTAATVLVTNGNGESLWLGPNYLDMLPRTDTLPATNYPTYQGPATRYPITNHVFGLPTNFNSVSVTVSLRALYQTRSADLSILLVSPLGKQIMLMSNLGGNHSVSYGNISFSQGAFSQPSQSGPLLAPGQYSAAYQPSNYGGVEQMPQVGSNPPTDHTGAYSANLLNLQHDNPNGAWTLYIYDMVPGMNGHLDSSWRMNFYFQ